MSASINRSESDDDGAVVKSSNASLSKSQQPAVVASAADLLASMQLEANDKQTNYNLLVCCVTLFCAEASRGLFMSGRNGAHTLPSLWSCVQHIGMSHSFLSWCIPLFSVGRMFGSWSAGAASDRWKDDGVPTLACMIASILGGMMYVMADMHRSWVLLLVAEFTMGLGGGTLAVLRAHVSKITTDRKRISHMTYASTAQFVGLGLMPLAALAINYAFVGQHHRDAHAEALEEHNLLLATATGVIGDALAQYAATPSAAAGSTDKEFVAHYRGGGTRRKHPGLENSAAGRARPSQHGGRHLLSSSSTSEQTGVGAVGSVAAATALLGPVVLPSSSPEAPSTFLSRFFNHRTAPALLLIALNAGCILLYFMFFEAGHQSLEFQAKKAVEAAKAKVEQAVTKARKEGKEFDADNEIEGAQASAFKDPPPPEADADAPAAAASADSSSASGGGGIGGSRKKLVKELIFDLSKFDALNLGGGSVVEDGAVSSSDPAAAKPALSIVQISDTTVIVLKPFSDSAPAAAEPEASLSTHASSKVSHRGAKASPPPSAAAAKDADEEDLELDRRGAVHAGGAPRSGASTSTLSSLVAGAAGIAGAVVSLFKPDAQSARAVAASKGSIQSASASSSSSPANSASPATSGFDGGQSSRIAAYESGRASHDLDNEGVRFGPLLLTPERMILWGSCLFVYLNYTIRGVLATVETIGTPTLARFQHIAPGSPLEVEASATFFGLLGLLGCVVFFLQWYLQDWIDEPSTLIAGFAVTVVGSGMIMFFPASEKAFLFGCVCIWSFGLPAVQNSVLSALSRILGTRPQGTWMGWIQTFGSLGRVTFPLITKVFSVSFAFFLSTLGCAIAIILLIVYMKLVRLTM